MTVAWELMLAWKGVLLIGLFLDYCSFAISVQDMMFGVPRIYCVYIFRIVVLGDFRRIDFAKMQNDKTK